MNEMYTTAVLERRPKRTKDVNKIPNFIVIHPNTRYSHINHDVRGLRLNISSILDYQDFDVKEEISMEDVTFTKIVTVSNKIYYVYDTVDEIDQKIRNAQ